MKRSDEPLAPGEISHAPPLKRRHFVQAATAYALFTTAASPGIAALAGVSHKADYAFFDERFQMAHRVASSWDASKQLIAVHGDITPLWTDGLDRMTRERPLSVRGVTTESFLFCLRVLAGEHADVAIEVSRLDRNLLLWMMRTTPKLKNGTVPWPSLYHPA